MLFIPLRSLSPAGLWSAPDHRTHHTPLHTTWKQHEQRASKAKQNSAKNDWTLAETLEKIFESGSGPWDHGFKFRHSDPSEYPSGYSDFLLLLCEFSHVVAWKYIIFPQFDRNRQISRRIKRPPSQCTGNEMAVGIGGTKDNPRLSRG